MKMLLKSIIPVSLALTNLAVGQDLTSPIASGIGGRNMVYDEDAAINNLIQEIDSSFSECGVDIKNMRNPDMPDPTAIFQMMTLSRPCSASEEDVMRNAFLHFEDCSGYEELELEEDLFVAMVGAMIKCVNSMGALDIAQMNIPEQCAIAVLGNNPLGQMLRDEILRPEGTEKCFAKLAEEVPICTVDLWPYAVDGKSVKMGACLASKFEAIFQEQCVQGLETLNGCLPPASELRSLDCRKYTQECTDGVNDSAFAIVLMGMPRTLRGMPLPDSCQLEAKEHGRTEQVERYEAFRDKCASAGKEFWERLEHPENDPSNPKLKTVKEFVRQIEKGDEKQSLSKAKASTEAQPASSGGSFGTGMLAGIALVVVGYGILLFVLKQRGVVEKIGLPGYVELPSF